MSDAGTPFKVTLKAGPGYEAPWFSIEADTAQELQQRIESVTEGTVQALLNAHSVFSGSYNAARGLGGTVVSVESEKVDSMPAARPVQRQQVDEVAAPAPVCQHGAMVRRTGTSAKGAWGAYFCPQPKNASDKCEPIWDKKG